MARANTIVTQNAGEELMNRVLSTICAALLGCSWLRLRSLRTQPASQYSTVTASSSRCRRIYTTMTAIFLPCSEIAAGFL